MIALIPNSDQQIICLDYCATQFCCRSREISISLHGTERFLSSFR